MPEIVIVVLIGSTEHAHAGGAGCCEAARLQGPRKATTVGTGAASGLLKVSGCDAISGGAPWSTWETGKFASKISAANAALIDHAEIKLKGTVYASCNFSGSNTTAGASMSGTVTFKDAIGEKVKGGKGSFVAILGADLPSQSAVINGIMSKGFAVGHVIRGMVGFDIAAPENQDLLACNLALLCPPSPASPSILMVFKTNAASVLRIGAATNGHCIGINDPWDCCSGAGLGTCD